MTEKEGKFIYDWYKVCKFKKTCIDCVYLHYCIDLNVNPEDIFEDDEEADLWLMNLNGERR